MTPLVGIIFACVLGVSAQEARLVPWDLSVRAEADLLGPGRSPRLWAVATSVGAFHAERQPLVLVHGAGGRPGQLQALADLYRDSPSYQVYILAFDSLGRTLPLNGDGFARELYELARLSPRRALPVTVVAHSLGGVLTRAAVNALGARVSAFGRVRVVAVDSPWHGYPGPSDEAGGGFLVDVARSFVPPGLVDMRSRSRLFAGTGEGRRGLLDEPLADNVEFELVFAEDSPEVLDYTEGPVAELPDQLVGVFRWDRSVAGDPRLVNFWKALVWSRPFIPFHEELSRAAAAGPIDRRTVLEALGRSYPRFPGDHMSVITRTGPGSFQEYLTRLLGR